MILKYGHALKGDFSNCFYLFSKAKAYRESVTIKYRTQIGDTSDMGIRV
jgi:hypothetical protein